MAGLSGMRILEEMDISYSASLPATWPPIRARRVGYSVVEWPFLRLYKAINDLKREKNAVYWRIITDTRNFPLHCDVLATACNWRARPLAPRAISSCNAVFTSWPKHRNF